MVLSGIGGGAAGVMAQARMNIRADGNQGTTDQSASGTSGMSAGSLSEASSSTVSSVSPATSASTSNMMADFFVKNTMEQSRYVRATLDNLDLAAQMRENLKADSFTLLDAAGGPAWARTSVGGDDDNKYTDAVLKQFETDRLAKNEKETETVKASEEHLKETRDDIEQAADEATQGKTGTDAAEAGSGTPKDAANSGAGDATNAEGAGADGAGSPGKTEESGGVTAPADALLNGSENGTGDTVVEAVERFQTANIVQQASSVSEASQEPATALAAAAASVQGVSSGGASGLGTRVDMLV